jgi:hypothetical protein
VTIVPAPSISMVFLYALLLEIGPMHSDPLQTRRGLDSKATA